MNNEIINKDITSVLSGIANAVVGHFDEHTLLDQIINTTMDTLQARVCSIFLEDKENELGLLVCRAGSGFAEKIIGVAKYKIGEGFTGSVAKYGGEFNIKSRYELENLKIAGVKIWRGNFDRDQWPSGESEFRNLIALPLQIKGDIIGVIKAENKKEEFGDFFSDEDFINFKTIANVISLAIENARLHRKAEEQTKKIPEALSMVTGAVVGHFNMEELLSQITNTLLNTLSAEICSIWLEEKDKHPGYIRCVAGHGFDKNIVNIAEYKIGEGFTGHIVKSGKEYNIRNEKELNILKKNKIWSQKYDHLQYAKGKNSFKNLIAVPLVIKDTILGAIKVENKIGDRTFSNEDLTVLKTIANVIALAIQNSLLHQKLEMQLKSIFTSLSDIASSVVGHFDEHTLLDQIITTTMDTLQARVCSIFLEDKAKEPGFVVCRAGSGFAEKIIGVAKYRIGEGFTGSVAKYGGEFNIKSRYELENLEIAGVKVWRGNFDSDQWPSGESEFRNLIALPLQIKGDIIGVIKAENKKEEFGDFFSDEDFINFKTIANVIALAIDNARLYKKLEKQLKVISTTAAHRIGNQVADFDGLELDFEFELKNMICDKENLHEFLKRLKTIKSNVKDTINEFNKFGKPIELEKEYSSINQIIIDEAWLLKPDGFSIQTNLVEIPNCLIDKKKIAESVKELLKNAKKAILNSSKPDGYILVRTFLKSKDKNDFAQIVVEDNGPGFKVDFPIFEPFLSTNPNSMGLGLASVKEITEKHDGTIEVGKSEFGGARIEITIPINR